MTQSMTSLREGYRAIVFGATGGLGRAFIRALDADPRCAGVFAASRSGAGVAGAEGVSFDLADEASIEAAIEHAFEDGPVHLAIAATGVLHDERIGPEKTWRHLSAEALHHAYAVNAVGPALIAKHALSRFPAKTRCIYAALSARVGSISDNRLGGWHAYRASKAALNQLIRTSAIELARKRPEALCVGLHPGTVDTGLSEPFQANVPDGKLFSPEYSAGKLLEVLDGLPAERSGRLFDYAGLEIDP